MSLFCSTAADFSEKWMVGYLFMYVVFFFFVHSLKVKPYNFPPLGSDRSQAEII